ncbi:fibronectin type III domain-containing protein [Tenacibaculum halocynthiae]|uniref:fibronectin type III domain-containing protein n=1 Tax=Tenacibaculum halocynthiae TaxID=1254437 RepID=UPI003D6524F1
MKRILPLIFTLFSLVANLYSQQYPVTIVPRVSAPAPVNFYNYADETSLNSPITVQIFLNDITVSNRQIRLRTYFEGGNIQFRSKDFVLGAENLYLEGGVPLTLRNQELAPYYKYENIEGINTATYAQTIPEGSYNFCFEVYDYLSGAKLSSKKCATVFIFKNEPPILNLPFNKANIEPQDFENIVFQWTPRHINVSNVEYEFALVEVWDNHIDPRTAFLSQAPIYETTTRTTTLVYGPDKPLLLPGKRYAWRVRAKALQGLEEIGLFKNQGYSEVFWFSRTAPCQVPEDVNAEAKGTSKINVFWNQDPTIHSEFIIAYREADKQDAHWFTKRTNSGWATIWGLKPGTTYEYKVKGKCAYQYSEYSDLQRVSTDIIQNEDANYQCGIVPDAVAISNREPHPGLNIGDQITAGDFKVTITEMQSQSNGVVSGKGFVAIPYLKFAKFGVTFSNILVNSSNQLAEGEIVTLYDPEFGEGASMTVDVDVNISEGVNGDNGVLEDSVTVDFIVDSIEIDANGAIVVTGTNGETAVIPGDDDVDIISSNGDVWSVGEDGTVTQQEGAEGGAVTDTNTNGLDSSGNVNSITASGVSVVFENSGYYHFDELPNGTSTKFEKEYKVLDKSGSKYKVAYKVISDTNGDDFINAKVTINNSDVKKEDLVFKTKDGAKIEVTSWNGDIAKLKLKRKYHYADEEVFAVIKNKDDKFDVAGSVILTHLASEKLETINITLVPVGISEVDSKVKEQVKEIYRKAGVRLNIQEVDEVSPEQIYGWDKDKDGRLKVGDSSVLSHYTDEEAVFNNYIKKQNYYSKKTYYVFVTNVPVNKSDVEGFMALKRQFGFVFTANAKTVEKQTRTLAHELGHGVFGLQHTWDEYKFPQGATNSLMDYGNGTVLNHLDWKKMHAPGIKIYWFQGDEDGQHITESGEFPNKFLNTDKESFTFVTPTGDYIDIPKNAKNITFTFGIYDLERSKDMVTGCLYAFEIDGKKYEAHYDGTSFYGYKYSSKYYSMFDSFEGIQNYKGYEDNVVMGLPNSTNFVINKFQAKNLDLFSTNNKMLGEHEFKVIPFSDENKVIGKGKTYAYSKALIGKKADQLNFEVYSKLLSKHNEKSTLLSVLKIIQLANAYEKMYKTFDECIIEEKDKTWYHKADKFFDFVLDASGTVDCYVNIIPNARDLIKSDNKYDFYNLYLKAFKEYIGNHVDGCGELLSGITKDSDVGSIESCVSLLSEKDIEKIPTNKRLLAISIMLDENWVDNSQEKQLIRLIKNVAKNDVDNFLEGLLKKSLIEGENYSLIRGLTSKIDNDHTFITDDYYKDLILALIELTVKKSDKFKKQLSELKPDDVIQRNIDFSYITFWQTVFADLNLLWNFVKKDSIFTYDTNADWVEPDKDRVSSALKIWTNIYVGKRKIGIAKKSIESIGVFEPTFFANKSSLSMLKDFNKDEVILAPAILTYYADDVSRTQTIIDGAEATVDIVSLATGYGALARGPSLARKVFIIADMVGSGVSLTTKIVGYENMSPEVQTFVSALNILTAGVAVTEVAGQAKNLKLLFKKVKELPASNQALPSKSQVELFLNQLKKAEGKLDELYASNPEKIAEVKVWLLHLEMEAKLGNIPELSDKIKDAKRILMSLDNLTETVRNITRKTFNDSFTAAENLKDKAWELFKEEKWDDLYKLFKDNDINNWNGVIWPPGSGFAKITDKIKGSNYTETIDRFQKSTQPSLGGGFGSPIRNNAEGVDDLVFTYDSRMLDDKLKEGTYYFEFKMSEKATDVELTVGDVAPWFNKQANLAGEQIEFSKKLHELDISYFKEGTIKAKVLVLGKWRKCVVKEKSVITDLQNVFNRLPIEVSDDIVDYINKSEDVLNKFLKAKESDKLDELIEAYKIFRKHGNKTPCL